MTINIPHHTQIKGSSSCGPVCLKMIFEFYGRTYLEEYLMHLCKTEIGKGTRHEMMIDVVKKEGFFIKSFFFYVNKELVFADPNNGDNFKMKTKDFLKSWHNSKNTSKNWFLVIKNSKKN